MSSCYDSLERPDWRQAKRFNSWDDVQKQILQTQDDPLHQTNPQDYVILTPSLVEIRNFIDLLSQNIVPKHDTSVFWGMVGLIIKVHDHPTYSYLLEVLIRLRRFHKTSTVPNPAFLECCAMFVTRLKSSIAFVAIRKA